MTLALRTARPAPARQGVQGAGEAAPERWLRWITEVPTALVVLAEVLILFTGIVARAVFERPIVWSDELASILFLWLAMLGSAIAVQRQHPMRLTFFVGALPPRLRAVAETLAVATVLLFFVLIFRPTLDYVQDQGFVETPALGWSGVVRALAIPVGCALAIASCAMRIIRHDVRDIAIAVCSIAIVGFGLHEAAPALTAMGNWALIVFFVGVLGFAVVSGVPIAFAFALATSAYLNFTTRTPLTIVVGRMDEGMGSLILLAVPLFVLLGQLVDATGMARVMVAFLASILGHVRGGMSYVLLSAMLLVSGISGSKTADMAAVAPVLFPEMRKRGMPDGEMVSLLAASGAMSETIPPSIVLIAIASVTGV